MTTEHAVDPSAGSRPPSSPREVLRGFDFKANPSIDPAVVHTLAKCEWVKKGQWCQNLPTDGFGSGIWLISRDGHDLCSDSVGEGCLAVTQPRRKVLTDGRAAPNLEEGLPWPS